MILKQADILFESADLLALNKPFGMASQVTADPSRPAVLPALTQLLASLGRPRRQLWLVHRLDLETSGVLLVAASSERSRFLAQEFRARRIAKTYLALSYGLPAAAAFTETAALTAIDPLTRRVWVAERGRSAVTDVQLLAQNSELGVCLLACHPRTGRSHQIRAHLAHNGLPIVGDKVYLGAPERPWPTGLRDLTLAHHFLHASQLQFTPGPRRQRLQVTAPLPPLFAAFLTAAGLELPAFIAPAP